MTHHSLSNHIGCEGSKYSTIETKGPESKQTMVTWDCPLWSPVFIVLRNQRV